MWPAFACGSGPTKSAQTVDHGFSVSIPAAAAGPLRIVGSSGNFALTGRYLGASQANIIGCKLTVSYYVYRGGPL